MSTATRQHYQAHRLAWIKKRARRIQRFYQVARRLAIFDAALDFSRFMGGAPC